MTAPLAPLAFTLPPPAGEAVIRFPAGGSEVVITTTSRLAGAVHSLTWGGVEFIDSLDHGRQLQSASSFDAGRPGPFWAECYNPTEAGGRRDHVGPRSTSRLLHIHATPTTLDTACRMAFWLPPGEKSQGRPALNDTLLSDHVLRKSIRLNAGGRPHAIDYRVVFTVPPSERSTFAQFEALTGYMPPKFSVFETLDVNTGQLVPIGAGPGEQPKPLVFSTPDGGHAMGAVAHDFPAGLRGPGYGRWNFAAEKVVKWNAVFRLKNPAGIPPGDYAFRLTVAVGNRETVRATLAAAR